MDLFCFSLGSTENSDSAEPVEFSTFFSTREKTLVRPSDCWREASSKKNVQFRHIRKVTQISKILNRFNFKFFDSLSFSPVYVFAQLHSSHLHSGTFVFLARLLVQEVNINPKVKLRLAEFLLGSVLVKKAFGRPFRLIISGSPGCRHV